MKKKWTSLQYLFLTHANIEIFDEKLTLEVPRTMILWKNAIGLHYKDRY